MHLLSSFTIHMLPWPWMRIQQVRLLSLQLHQQRIEFTASGLFTIDHGLMFNVSIRCYPPGLPSPCHNHRVCGVKYLPSVIVSICYTPLRQIVGSLATYLLILIQFDIAQNGAKWKTELRAPLVWKRPPLVIVSVQSEHWRCYEAPQTAPPYPYHYLSLW